MNLGIQHKVTASHLARNAYLKKHRPRNSKKEESPDNPRPKNGGSPGSAGIFRQKEESLENHPEPEAPVSEFEQRLMQKDAHTVLVVLARAITRIAGKNTTKVWWWYSQTRLSFSQIAGKLDTCPATIRRHVELGLGIAKREAQTRGYISNE